MARSREYSKQGFRLIGEVSEYERAIYYLENGELNKAIDGYQLGAGNYPRFWGFHNYLSMIYVDMGRYDAALKEGLEAIRLQPTPNLCPPRPDGRRPFNQRTCGT